MRRKVELCQVSEKDFLCRSLHDADIAAELLEVRRRFSVVFFVLFT